MAPSPAAVSVIGMSCTIVSYTISRRVRARKLRRRVAIRAPPRFAILAPYGTMNCVANLAVLAGPAGQTWFPWLACRRMETETHFPVCPDSVHRSASRMTPQPKPRILSGMRPTGKLHLGNLVGALTEWVKQQDYGESFHFVADWHMLTTDYADTTEL